MPDLLLELFSEEIPARMQRRAADDLRRLVTDGLVAAGLTYAGAKAFATPRRLALTVHGVTARSADTREERKGPRVGAPDQALQGFLRAAGLASIDQAEIQSDPRKGEFYLATVTKPGRPAEEIISSLVPEVIRGFPWPKSMRWGARSAPADSPYSAQGEGAAALRWVRPLRSILCTFGPETEEPTIVPVAVAGVEAGNVTYGHRFLAGPQPIRVRRFDDYVPALEAAKVVLDADRRMAIIETEAKNLAFAQGLELVEDPGLLEEAAGLVEWPVVLMGSFDPGFLDIPPEVVRLTIRANQKCFVLREAVGDVGEGVGSGAVRAGASGGGVAPHSVRPDGRLDLPLQGGDTSAGVTGLGSPRLTNRFVLVSNMEASDGGRAIVAGNERVIAARLSDARFFWEGDKATKLEDWAQKLGSVTFHEKLGSQAERVERIARLARELAPLVGADPDDAERAARLAKADLTTGMVGEFPELQGVMGRYYFLAQSFEAPLRSAPQDEGSNLPLEGRSRAAEPLREGVDGEAVRAGASGVAPHSVRPDGRLDLPLQGGDTGDDDRRIRAIADAIRDHYKPQGPSDSVPREPVSVAVALADKLDTLVGFWAIDEKPTGSKDPFALRRAALGVIRLVLAGNLRIAFTRPIRQAAILVGEQEQGISGPSIPVLIDDLLAFFADRLKVYLREAGARHNLIDAVFAAGGAGAPSAPGTRDVEQRLDPGEGRERGVLRQGPSPGSELRSDSASPVPGEEGNASASGRNDDLLMILRRVEALGKFLDTEDGANLLVGYRRAANILRAEEKKDGEGAFAAPPDPELIAERGLDEERALFEAMRRAEAEAGAAVAREDFAAAMSALATLRPAVDAFFDKVTVNADDPALRTNRLRLLNMLRRATLAVADFSRIGG